MNKSNCPYAGHGELKRAGWVRRAGDAPPNLSPDTEVFYLMTQNNNTPAKYSERHPARVDKLMWDQGHGWSIQWYKVVTP